ncbi:MAG: thiaminase II [Nitriliruptorales bacterium]|nr:thiaminase II [Nitriliruptorales bacterium]
MSLPPVTTTEGLWDGIEDIYRAILAHPFLAGLTDGTLGRDVFRYYVTQDAHYLRDYARALSVCAGRAPREDDVAMFSEHSAGAIAVERALHGSFFAEFGMTPEDIDATPVAPTNQAYISYLLASVHSGSFAEAVGAVLPCYWIYWEVGKHLLKSGSPDPLYQRWIDTYGGEEFGDIVQAVLDVTDRIGGELGDAELARVRDRFVTTSRYEWMFWDAAWRQESWPI